MSSTFPRSAFLMALLLQSSVTRADKLDSGSWRLYYHSSGFYSLDYKGETFLQDPYSWLPIMEGKLEKKATKDSLHLKWSDRAAGRHPGYTSAFEVHLGEGECALIWKQSCHQQPKGMELAVFLPDEFFRSPGKEATATFVQRNGNKGTTALRDGPGIGGAGQGLVALRSLTLAGDRRTIQIEMLSGAESGYGWSFQDYRQAPNAPGCYRLVFSWDSSPFKADLKVLFQVKGETQ
ncbi:MAG: hypothetical protein HY318_05140 [Armatimonadetes bacterium]|nr:hypothetical protein [Armatimonadota bacterium]